MNLMLNHFMRNGVTSPAHGPGHAGGLGRQLGFLGMRKGDRAAGRGPSGGKGGGGATCRGSQGTRIAHRDST